MNISVREIKEGFQLNSMEMGNAETGLVVWHSDNVQEFISDSEQLNAQIPKEILSFKAVSRNLNFSSKHEIKQLKLQQTMFLHGNPFEQFEFLFGFVMPGSTNNWTQMIESAGKDNMIPPEILSGNLVVETKFYDNENLISKSKVRIYYI